MDLFKAAISIGDISIQLEGSREFVEKYLDQYGSFVEKRQSSPAAGETVDETKDDKKTIETRRTRMAAKSGCSERIRTLISENYFAEPRTGNEVTNWLKDQKSVTYQINQVAAALSTLIKSGKLRRFKESGKYKYRNV